jgi:hypothetical protein
MSRLVYSHMCVCVCEADEGHNVGQSNKGAEHGG